MNDEDRARLREQFAFQSSGEAALILSLLDEVERLQEDNGDYGQLFELQHRREMEAIQRWRTEAPEERALTMPDFGRLLDWLHDERERLQQRIEELEADFAPIIDYMEWGADHSPGCAGGYKPGLEKCGLLDALAALERIQARRAPEETHRE